MLQYVRDCRPAIAIIESVDENANADVFDAAVLSLRTCGYTVSMAPMCASEEGPMFRARRMWLATR